MKFKKGLHFFLIILLFIIAFLNSCGPLQVVTINSDKSANVEAWVIGSNPEQMYTSPIVQNFKLEKDISVIDFKILTLDSLGQYLSPIFYTNRRTPDFFKFQIYSDSLRISFCNCVTNMDTVLPNSKLYMKIVFENKVKKILYYKKSANISKEKNVIYIIKPKRKLCDGLTDMTILFKSAIKNGSR